MKPIPAAIFLSRKELQDIQEMIGPMSEVEGAVHATVDPKSIIITGTEKYVPMRWLLQEFEKLKVVKKNPSVVGREEAADMAVEFHQGMLKLVNRLLQPGAQEGWSYEENAN